MALLRQNKNLLGNISGSKYTIVKPLGKGSFGEVYKARDKDKKVCALKIFYEPLKSGPEQKAFEAEKKTCSKIDHKNVIDIFDYGEITVDGDNFGFVVMEYAQKGDLRTKLQKIKKEKSFLSQKELFKCFEQILKGVDAIHESKIIHRDIKPENILLINNTCKITDFGLAKYVEEATKTLTFKGTGTMAYMAPETWEVQSASPATDIYSLGILFYEMSTFNLPFKAENEQEWRNQHLYEAIPYIRDKNKNVSIPFEGVIRRMMNKEPNERYQNIKGVIDAFKEALTVGKKEDETLKPIIEKAVSKMDMIKKEETEVKRKAKQEEEKRQKINLKIKELLSRFDQIVKDVNQHLKENKIIMGEGHDSPRRYGYMDKEIKIKFYDPFCIEDDYDGSLKKLKIEGDLKERGLVKIGHAMIIGSDERGGGFHFLLIKDKDDMYGKWHVAYIKSNPLSGRRFSVEPAVIEDLDELLRALFHHFHKTLDIYNITTKEFDDGDFKNLLEEIVS